jgi:hypothetical protein
MALRQKNVRRELPAQEIESGDGKPFSEPSSRNFLEEDFHLIKIVANGSLFNVKRSAETENLTAHRQHDATRHLMSKKT